MALPNLFTMVKGMTGFWFGVGEQADLRDKDLHKLSSGQELRQREVQPGDADAVTVAKGAFWGGILGAAAGGISNGTLDSVTVGAVTGQWSPLLNMPVLIWISPAHPWTFCLGLVRHGLCTRC